jgi:deltex
MSQLIVPSNGSHQCSICLNQVTDGQAVCTIECDPHKHGFCHGCLDQWMKSNMNCPYCNVNCGIKQGDMPDGIMAFKTVGVALPGFDCPTIVIQYIIPDGIQDERHEKPGEPFSGTMRNAFLPCNDEGLTILRLLRKAFDNKLTFRVGTSLTTGEEDTVCWTTIHHKTSYHGTWGYPDVTYLNRVEDELSQFGIS